MQEVNTPTSRPSNQYTKYSAVDIIQKPIDYMPPTKSHNREFRQALERHKMIQ